LGKEVKHDEWMIEHIKDENRELKSLEKELERQQKKMAEEAESWSGDGVNEKTNSIHMNPLTHHHDDSKDMLKIVSDLTALMKNRLGNITKTGPAASHHMGKILPTHNFFKPGAHPSKKSDSKKDNKHDDHKDKKEEHHKSAEELRNRLKPVKIQ
jgi:hypothetical protein